MTDEKKQRVVKRKPPARRPEFVSENSGLLDRVSREQTIVGMVARRLSSRLVGENWLGCKT